MMKSPLLLAASAGIFTITPVFGQIPDALRLDYEQKSALTEIHDGCHTRPAMVQAGQRALVKRPYDVLKYQLTMDWRNPLTTTVAGNSSHTYSGVNVITLRCDSAGMQIIVLDAAGMTIDSVFQLPIGKRLPVTPLSSEKSVAVDMLSPKKLSDTVIIAVYYTHTSRENRGFHLYPKGLFVGMNQKGDTVRTHAPIAYTMNEPEDARYWMPCNDRPYDKAQFELTLTLPFTPGATDNFVPSTTTQGAPLVNVGADSRTFAWKDTTQIPTYLVSINVSYFAHFRQWYNRVSNPADSIPIDNYVWKPDYEETETDGSRYNARHALRRMPEMMEFYSNLLTEYPFESYGHTAVHPFAFGGMEHQTMTTVNRSWLYGHSESGFAHELMHQWTGDLVTCATWADIWLNEGGATFGEALWAEYNGSRKGYKDFLRGAKGGYLRREQPAVWGIPIQNLFNYGTTYAKSAWIYAMLRTITGDTVFFPTLKNYFREYAYSSVETEDMLQFFEREAPNPAVPYRTFFDQWLYKRGHPEYKVVFTSQKIGAEYNSTIHLSQLQTGENVPDVFVMPVTLTLVGANNERFVTTVISDAREKKLQIATTFPVTSILIDEQENILCLTSDAVVSVEESVATPDAFSVSPNPSVNGVFTVTFSSTGGESPVKITLYDMNGQALETLYNAVVPAGAYSLAYASSVPAGMYYLRLESGGNVIVRPLSQLR